jgi:hypothetical protein
MNLSSNSFWADINFGTATGSLSNNINYNKLTYHSIYFSKLGVEREGGREYRCKAFSIFDYYINI